MQDHVAMAGTRNFGNFKFLSEFNFLGNILSIHHWTLLFSGIAESLIGLKNSDNFVKSDVKCLFLESREVRLITESGLYSHSFIMNDLSYIVHNN